MPDPPPPPIQLTILRQGSLNLVDLAELGSLIPRSETHVDDDFLRELAAETAHLAGAARAGAGTRALERVGKLVFSHLLTEPARERLRAAAPGDLYLRLDEQLVHVPWELCHDGRDFLVTKFRLGRQVITSQRIPERPPPRPAGALLRVLLVVDPTASLPQASAEAEQLCALLDTVAGVEVTLIGGKSVRRIPLLAALHEHDVVHFAGHSHYDAAIPARSGWQLAEGVLTAGELSKLRPAPALVFSNSCEAGTTPAWEGGYGYEGHAFGIGSALLLAGVQNYIGTFWVVHDEESVLFATTCYRALAGGATLGAALLEARHAVIAQRGWGGLTWASYLLYGDPAFAPLPCPPAAVAAPQPPPPAITAPSSSGYRFTVEVSAGADETAVGVVPLVAAQMVGRAAELAVLERALERARGGVRAVVLACGPPGIGKTTLVDALLERVRVGGHALIGRGQSVEQYGTGEAYLPLLDAWSRLAREAQGRTLLEQLRRHAPTWLAQLPGLLDPTEHDALQRRAQGATRERMLREMAELLEAVTTERPLVLALEDLHWSDHSTLELIAYVAQRREPARFLLIGTYRPAEAKRGDHPLRAIAQELQARRCAEEIRLGPLAPVDVGHYLRARLGGAVDPDLVGQMHRRTDGHPLFLVNVVDFALREGLLAEQDGAWALRGGSAALDAGVPESLRQMIERQVEALTADERQALEAASVVGAEFAIAAVAAALQVDAEALDECCEGLAWKGQLLQPAGVEEWPDGTVSGRYRFVHALYRDVLYDRVAAARRVRLHRRIAERKLAAYGGRASEIAGEIAAHFEAARDPARAVSYHAQAGDTAVARHADHEAIEHLSKAIRQLASLPDAPDRAQLELDLYVKLATPLMSTRGYAAREVQDVFERAHTLSRRVAAGPHLFPLLRGLASFHQVGGRLLTARAVGEELLALCADGDDRLALTQAHYGHGVTLYGLAELDAARSHLEQALALYDPAAHAAHVSVYGGYDPGVACRCWSGWLHWACGRPDTSLRFVREGLALAERLEHPFTLNFAHLAAATVYLYRGEATAARSHLDHAAAIGQAEGFAYQLAAGGSLEGWALLTEGRPDAALARLRAALDGFRTTGAAVNRPASLGLLAYATAMSGRVDEALEHVRTGIEEAERTHERLHLVQLYQARGHLLGGRGGPAAAEASYARALELAREFGAAMLELRAATSLARCWTQLGRTDDARALLAPIVAGFREGLELPDLLGARSLLEG